MKQEVKVEGMTCNGCANTVKLRFAGIPQVDNVEVDLENKKAVLESENAIGEDQLIAALEGTSYTVVK